MAYCPYDEYELEMWDGVTNPMGKGCNDCTDYECEHNPNPCYEDDFQEMYENEYIPEG